MPDLHSCCSNDFSEHIRFFLFACNNLASCLCTVTDIVEAITPHKLQTLRQLLNSSAMDIMYYTSPLYGCEVRYATDPT
jgi:phospholipase DDHD1